MRNIIYIIFFKHIFFVKCFIPNAIPLMLKESFFLNNLILDNNLPCHLTSSRIKTFESALYKLNKY